MSVKARVSVASMTLILGVLTGCHPQPRGDRYDLNGTQGAVAVIPNDVVILELPNVRVDKDTIYISGMVHRHPGVTGEIAGRVDIEFLGRDGEYLDGLPALLTPRTVPTNPNESATYSTSYGYVPPAGSTVRVHFIDKETQIQEDNSGSDYGYGGGHAGLGGARMPNSNTTHAAGGHAGGNGGTHW